MTTIAHIALGDDTAPAPLSGLCGEQSDLGAMLGLGDDER